MFKQHLLPCCPRVLLKLTRAIAEKLKEILQDDPDIPKSGKAADMIKKFSAQFTKVMSEKSKKSDDSEEKEAGAHKLYG